MRPLLIVLCVTGAFGQGPQPARPSYAALKYPPLNPVVAPKVEKTTLPNGLKLYLIEDRELPLVDGVALIRTGNLFDPPGKLGLAAITGALLRTGGTKGQTGEEIASRLETSGATVDSSIQETFGVLSFAAMAENTESVLEIVRDLLSAPAFETGQMEVIKSQLRNSIARRNDDPAGIVSREVRSLLYGRDTPYGATLEYAHVDRIRREDVVAFHRRYFFPANVLLALRGDFSAAALRARAEALFAEWSHTQPAVPPFPDSSHKPVPGIYVAERKRLPQTYFAVGHPGGMPSDPDHAALEVAAEILGGGLSSRIAARVRNETRAAYPIQAQWAAAYRHPGMFMISGGVKGTAAGQTLRAIREEMARMQSQEVSDSELEDGRRRVLNRLAFRFESKAASLQRLLTHEYFGYPDNFIEQYQKSVAAVTKGDVLRGARDRFHPDQLVVALAGDPIDFERSLGTLRLPVTSLDLTIREPEPVLSATGPEAALRGRELLKLAQDAAGGVERLERISDFTEVAAVQVDPGFGGASLKRTNRWIAPGYFRQDSELPLGRVSVYWDGASGWIAVPQGAGPLSPAARKQVDGELFRTFFRLLLSDRIPGRVVNATGDGTLEIGDGAANLVKLVIDETTGLPREMQYLTLQPNGPPAHLREIFTAYAEVDGIRVPFRRTIEQDGRRFGEVKVEEHRFNTGLKPVELGRWR